MAFRLRLRPILPSSQPSPSSISISSFLLPFLHLPYCRNASILASLRDNAGAYSKRIRRGRGPSSGKGKTSGRGHKGQKQHGKVPTGFNGGQTSAEEYAGKRGFTNVHSVDLVPVNLDRLQSWVEQGRIDPTRPITVKELAQSRCATNIRDGVKLLARGKEELRVKGLNVVVNRASAAAIAAIEAAGGSVMTRYYTEQSIRRIIKGETDPIVSLQMQRVGIAATAQDGAVVHQDGKLSPAEVRYLRRLPDPASRKDIEYYRDPAHRGYLSYQIEEGQGPSLFFRAPVEGKDVAKRNVKVKAKASENRLW